jgi:hypothetical protein
VIRRAMEQWCHDKRVEGLLFRYLHFWGSYEYVGTSRNWYRKEFNPGRMHRGSGFREGSCVWYPSLLIFFIMVG